MSHPPALTREAVRELDRRAIEEHGIASIVLMESAGRACADHALALRAGHDGPVVVLAGPGNNGGDGFVIARTLVNRGVQTSLFFIGERAKLKTGSPDARANAKLWEDLGQATRFVESLAEFETGMAAELARASVLVDALFGTGLDRPLRDPWLSVARAINAAERPVLAVDIPSGLDANTGERLGEVVRATRTVTFVAPKIGFELAYGPEACGEIVLAEIGIPRAYFDTDSR